MVIQDLFVERKEEMEIHDEEKTFVPGRFQPSAAEDVQAVKEMLAAAAGWPVVTIFTFNSPEVYGAAVEPSRAVCLHVPCSGKAVCRRPGECRNSFCLDGITVEQVFQAATEIL